MKSLFKIAVTCLGILAIAFSIKIIVETWIDNKKQYVVLDEEF